jgi:RNA polymerase sigma factor (TIGR02999 family)
VDATVQVDPSGLGEVGCPLPEHVVEALAGAGEHSDPARRHLFASLYQELHGMARRELHRMGLAITLGATTLLHEAYLDLGERRGVLFPDRARFLAYASRVMRGLVLGHVRSRRRLKRGTGFEIGTLPTEVPERPDSPDLQRLSDAIEELATIEPRLAQVVDLKYFGGFSFTDIAAMFQMCERTVQRDWVKARLFLHRALSESDRQ